MCHIHICSAHECVCVWGSWAHQSNHDESHTHTDYDDNNVLGFSVSHTRAQIVCSIYIYIWNIRVGIFRRHTGARTRIHIGDKDRPHFQWVDFTLMRTNARTASSAGMVFGLPAESSPLPVRVCGCVRVHVRVILRSKKHSSCVNIVSHA